MLIYLDELGNVAQSVTERVGRNSNDASVIYVVSFFPAASAVYMTFTLPNGKALFGGLADGATGEDIPQMASFIGSIGEGMTVWRYSVPQAVTALSGVVSYTIYAQNGEVRSSAAGTFTVAYGSRIVLPESPTEDAWNQILDRLSTDAGDIDELIDIFNGVETRLQAVENPTGEVAPGEKKPVSGEQIYQFAEEALESAKEYADHPRGDVAPDETLPVSGEKVYDAVLGGTISALNSAENYADNPRGDVAPDTRLPVSGGKIYTAIKAFSDPLEARVDALEETVEGMPFYFTTTEKTGVDYAVPDESMGYARVNSITFLSSPSRNLFPFTPGQSILRSAHGNYADVYMSQDGEVVGLNDNEVGRSEELIRIYAPGTVSISIEAVGQVEDGELVEETGGAWASISDGYDSVTIYPTEGKRYAKLEGITPVGEWSLTWLGHWSGASLRIMVNEGDKILPWEPCLGKIKTSKLTRVASYDAQGNEIDAYELPSSIQSLEGYGIGVEGVAENELDFRAKTFRKVAAIAKGARYRSKYAGTGFGAVYRVEFTNPNTYLDLKEGLGLSVCSHAFPVNNLAYREPYEGTTHIFSGQNIDRSLLFRSFSREDTEEAFTAYLAQQEARGTPLTLAYALDDDHVQTVEVADHILTTPYVKVSPGGKLVAESADGGRVRMSITYQIKTDPTI
ncbi:MAG: hypothetical protein J6W28_00360 [Clostridia bacterium]|nr:hypothetical protein [Clostridia bacterium]